LDALINNACQTVRRPVGWYDHVIAGELGDRVQLPAAGRAMLERDAELGHGLVRADPLRAGVWKSAVLAQVPLLAEDLERGNHLYPAGRLDAHLPQVDPRDVNSLRKNL